MKTGRFLYFPLHKKQQPCRLYRFIQGKWDERGYGHPCPAGISQSGDRRTAAEKDNIYEHRESSGINRRYRQFSCNPFIRENRLPGNTDEQCDDGKVGFVTVYMNYGRTHRQESAFIPIWFENVIIVYPRITIGAPPARKAPQLFKFLCTWWRHRLS